MYTTLIILLRATAITRMFNCGIPEKVIAENSGHRSTKALRCYERTSQKLQQNVTHAVNNSDSKPLTESKPVMAVPTGPAAQVLLSVGEL